ncbi:MAG: MBL fold metallo-hydrolase [Flavobacteriales bacterium]|nr:MBL fold metallo-hydrolase [Flavobacteriales bacterium]
MPGDHMMSGASLIVLGTIQDAGSPQIGCRKACCKDLYDQPNSDRKVVSLGLIDPESGKQYLFEATPDMVSQCHELGNYAGPGKNLPDAIFLTHAHIGHYTGLIHLGKEAVNASDIPVYVMPRMKIFLEENGPWNQLVHDQNISLQTLEPQKPVMLSGQLSVTPYVVPHRDEYSETVGFIIHGPNKSALFIPDIDKWERWETDIIKLIDSVDYAFLDATFYDGEELNDRDMAEIPHPFLVESISYFESLPETEKSKIYFIHFNHTNPVLDPSSKARQTVLEKGFNLTQLHEIFPL